MGEFIPQEWISVKKLKNRLQTLIAEEAATQEFKDLTDAQILSALSSVMANYLQDAAIDEIRKKRGKGCVFHPL